MGACSIQACSISKAKKGTVLTPQQQCLLLFFLKLPVDQASKIPLKRVASANTILNTIKSFFFKNFKTLYDGSKLFKKLTLCFNVNVPVLSCQPRVTVTSLFVYKVIRDLESIDPLCINPILRIGLIHK